VWKVKKDELDGNVMERSCKGNPLTCSVAWLAGRDHAIFYTNVTQPKYGSFHFFLFFSFFFQIPSTVIMPFNFWVSKGRTFN
jgi:hypothetical protein